jgi:hypothetical protein
VNKGMKLMIEGENKIDRGIKGPRDDWRISMKEGNVS